MDGKALAERIRGEIAEEVRELGEVGLATVLVGDDPASDIYIGLKHKAAGEVGINARDIRLASQTTEAELLEQVEQLNADDAIDGLLVQLPLPDHIDEARVLRSIDPRKDIDGLHPLNFGQLALGRPTHVGATPVGDDGAPRGVRRAARRRPRRSRGQERHRRQAGFAPPLARERDGHGLPLADARSLQCHA